MKKSGFKPRKTPLTSKLPPDAAKWWLKKKSVTKAVSNPYWKAVRRADKWFSLYIRHSQAKQGVIRCYCGRIVPVEESDCSHYYDRRHMGTRYDEENCTASCRACNRFEEGNKPAFCLYLVKKHGPDILQRLHDRAQTVTKMDVYVLDQIAENYKAKYKALNHPL